MFNLIYSLPSSLHPERPRLENLPKSHETLLIVAEPTPPLRNLHHHGANRTPIGFYLPKQSRQPDADLEIVKADVCHPQWPVFSSKSFTTGDNSDLFVAGLMAQCRYKRLRISWLNKRCHRLSERRGYQPVAICFTIATLTSSEGGGTNMHFSAPTFFAASTHLAAN